MKVSALVFAALLVTASANDRLAIVSLSTITTEIVTQVGGDLVAVAGLVKPGLDPHEYQPTPGDIKTISEAVVVFGSGKGMEGYLTKIEEGVGGKVKFVLVGNAFPSLKLEEDGKVIEDPHWWHSIANVEKATVLVRDTLIQRDAVHQGTYEKNAAIYLAKLNDLSTWAKTTIAQLPRAKRKLVTSHDAFQYFAHEFGFKIYAIEGVSSQDQPSSRKAKALIALIKKEQVKAIFAETMENPKVLEEITKETGAQLGGRLYADGLGGPEADAYEKMMKHNLSTIVRALQ